MARQGMSIMIVDPDPERNYSCGVCGATMDVVRRTMSARSWCGAMAGDKHVSDIHKCKHVDVCWHKRAEAIMQEVEKTASPTLRGILLKDAQDICRTRNNEEN